MEGNGLLEQHSPWWHKILECQFITVFYVSGLCPQRAGGPFITYWYWYGCILCDERTSKSFLGMRCLPQRNQRFPLYLLDEECPFVPKDT